MTPEQTNLLSLQRLPARLTLDQVAWYLGFGPHEIPVLVTSRLLKPLGNPAQNGQKYFATCELERLRNDEKWLNRASDAVTRYKRQRNQQERIRREVRDSGQHCTA
jgi:hypothetical protein